MTLDRRPRGFTLSVAYWTTSDPPCVESDDESKARVRRWRLARVSDPLRGNGQLVSNGTCGSMAVVLGASDRGVGWFDGPINASSTVTYVTQRLYFVGVSI